MTKLKVLRVFVAIGVAVIVGLVAISLINGRYLEAIAISSIGSIFAWFALGTGKIGD